MDDLDAADRARRCCPRRPSGWSAPSTRSPTTTGARRRPARLDPRPRRRPPRAERRGAGRRRSTASRRASRPDVRLARGPRRRHRGAGRGRARPSCASRLPGRRPPARPTRSTRCPRTTGRRTFERTPGGRTFAAAPPSRDAAARGRDPPRRPRRRLHRGRLAATTSRRTCSTRWPSATTVRRRRPACATDLDRDVDRRRRRRRPAPCPGSRRDLAWWLIGRGAGEGLTIDSGELPQVGGMA